MNVKKVSFLQLALLLIVAFSVLWVPVLAASMQTSAVVPSAADQIAKEVRHQLLMLSRLTVFDNLQFKVDGRNVTLLGAVTRPAVKQDAESAVKAIDGVESVKNEIEVLPTSPNDDRLRTLLFQAIYGFPALQRYDLPVIKPIRIIVRNGHVSLEGVVDSEADKNMVGIRANTVPGVFSVTNSLQVVSSQ